MNKILTYRINYTKDQNEFIHFSPFLRQLVCTKYVITLKSVLSTLDLAYSKKLLLALG